MKNENYDDNENSMTAEEFLDFMRKNRRTVPNEKRIANKDKLYGQSVSYRKPMKLTQI